jgi:hypothetical protein
VETNDNVDAAVEAYTRLLPSRIWNEPPFSTDLRGRDTSADRASRSNISMTPRVPFSPPVPDAPLTPRTIGSFTMDYSHRMTQMTCNLILFCPSKDYIGLAPRFAHGGDKFYLLLGCDTPVIIRTKDDGTHELIGAAYLHRFMRVEIRDFIARGELQLETFVMS